MVLMRILKNGWWFSMDVETYAILKNKLDVEKDRINNLDNSNLDLQTVVKSKNLFDGHF